MTSANWVLETRNFLKQTAKIKKTNRLLLENSHCSIKVPFYWIQLNHAFYRLVLVFLKDFIKNYTVCLEFSHKNPYFATDPSTKTIILALKSVQLSDSYKTLVV